MLTLMAKSYPTVLQWASSALSTYHYHATFWRVSCQIWRWICGRQSPQVGTGHMSPWFHFAHTSESSLKLWSVERERERRGKRDLHAGIKPSPSVSGGVPGSILKPVSHQPSCTAWVPNHCNTHGCWTQVKLLPSLHLQRQIVFFLGEGGGGLLEPCKLLQTTLSNAKLHVGPLLDEIFRKSPYTRSNPFAKLLD